MRGFAGVDGRVQPPDRRRASQHQCLDQRCAGTSALSFVGNTEGGLGGGGQQRPDQCERAGSTHTYSVATSDSRACRPSARQSGNRYTLLAGRPFVALGSELNLLLDRVADAASNHAGRVALTGILPPCGAPTSGLT
jgi:hypothetical protein